MKCPAQESFFNSKHFSSVKKLTGVVGKRSTHMPINITISRNMGKRHSGRKIESSSDFLY